MGDGEHWAGVDSGPIQLHPIRMDHVHGAEREVQTPRAPSEGPIGWGKLVRAAEGKVRHGQGESGLRYRLEQVREWQVIAVTRRGRELVVGSARMQDHALALAGMWEQAVLSGRVDVD
jgi:hypothetical protein